MSSVKIARRYAAALFELHQEGKLDRDELTNAAVAVGDTLAMQVIASPDYDKNVKASLIKAAIQTATKSVVTRLIDLLAERGKLSLLPEIKEQLDIAIARADTHLEVAVTVATELDKREQDSLSKTLKAMTGSEVVLNVQLDTSILGGLIVQIGDRKIDNSVRSKLDALKQAIVS